MEDFLRPKPSNKLIDHHKYQQTEDRAEEEGEGSRMGRVTDHLHLDNPVSVQRHQEETQEYRPEGNSRLESPIARNLGLNSSNRGSFGRDRIAHTTIFSTSSLFPP